MSKNDIYNKNKLDIWKINNTKYYYIIYDK